MTYEYIKNFYSEICQNFDGDYKIILENKQPISEDWLEFDIVKWEMEKPVQEFVNSLILNKSISLEEKIIKVYEFICLNYIYDANVLYFFKQDKKDPSNIKYIPADWYGRIVGKEWFEKRQAHNRRICYEFSRFYAKAINTLINNEEDLEAVIVGDKENTHYVVGLTGKKYSVILDQDDFNGIKDLTRLKIGLSIRGIHVLRDETGKFKKAIENFNKDKLEELPEIELAKKTLKENNLIAYFNACINALNKFHIDSQGFFEYIRFLIEETGIKVEKIWKEDKKNIEKRYERCLYFKYENETYLLDSISKTLTVVDLEKLDEDSFVFNSEEKKYKYYGG